jgi:hypothetical protein
MNWRSNRSGQLEDRRRHTSSKIPLARRILIAPLRYSSSWPIIPSTGGSGIFSVEGSSGFVGVAAPLPGPSGVANVTFFGVSTAFPFPLSTTGIGGSATTDGDETNVAKFDGN